MHDIVTKIGNSVIQYGNYNDRIYLMKLSSLDFPDIIDILNNLAQTNNYSKIFAKIPPYAKEAFMESGFSVEASVPQFYKDGHTAFFMSRFLTAARRQNDKDQEIKMVLSAAQQKAQEGEVIKTDLEFTCRMCSTADAPQMAELYRSVFATYPFPIYKPGYIVRTMQQNVIYFGIWHEGSLIALSSAEMDIESGNAEMTDFAVLPAYSGQGLSLFLLQRMETEVKKRQLKTAYTIARALSFGMNITFAKMAYKYSGTLINNTNISGSLESMNIWYKSL